jgi:hypothetical protein
MQQQPDESVAAAATQDFKILLFIILLIYLFYLLYFISYV